jgi:hypothetical protein
MRFPVQVVVLVLTAAVFAGCLSGPRSDGWVPLFDGESLEGWTASENPSTFTVRDGMIVANGPRAHLFYTGPVENADFTDFELVAEVRTEANANSGIYFHTAYQDSGWPETGYECQVNQTHADSIKSGSLYGVVKVGETYVQDGEWYTTRIRVEGKRIQVWINEYQVVDYEEPEQPGSADWPGRRLSSGTFCLQGHDPGSTVCYRSVRVRPLP